MKALLFLTAFLGTLCCFGREKKLILHANGKVQYEYEMEGSMLDGRFACYYETGKLRVKGQFSANQKTGLWRFWDEKGILRAERNYTDNLHFLVIVERDSSGAKLRPSAKIPVENQRALPIDEEWKVSSKNVLYAHRYLSSIDKLAGGNEELFADTGLAGTIIRSVAARQAVLFTDMRFVQPQNLPSVACYSAKDIVSFLIKEDFVCSLDAQGQPRSFNRITGICPIVVSGASIRELGWIYAPDISGSQWQLEKLQNYQYNSRIIGTTIGAPSFKLRTTSAGEDDQLRLIAISFEADAILYAQDRHSDIVMNQ